MELAGKSLGGIFGAFQNLGKDVFQEVLDEHGFDKSLLRELKKLYGERRLIEFGGLHLRFPCWLMAQAAGRMELEVPEFELELPDDVCCPLWVLSRRGQGGQRLPCLPLSPLPGNNTLEAYKGLLEQLDSPSQLELAQTAAIVRLGALVEDQSERQAPKDDLGKLAVRLVDQVRKFHGLTSEEDALTRGWLNEFKERRNAVAHITNPKIPLADVRQYCEHAVELRRIAGTVALKLLFDHRVRLQAQRFTDTDLERMLEEFEWVCV